MRSRILENMEDGKKLTANELAKKTNILEALHLLAMSWRNVSEKTIRNCFSHGGFTNKDLEIEVIPDPPTDLTNAAFEEWMSIDLNIQVAAKLTDTEICDSLTQTDQDLSEERDEDEDAGEAPTLEKIPTSAEVRGALQILRQVVQHRSSEFNKHYEYENLINELLRKSTRQTTLIDFF